MIENKSNISSYVYIPLMVSLIVKYVIGDWDENFQFSYMDILFFGYILAISVCTVYFITIEKK